MQDAHTVVDIIGTRAKISKWCCQKTGYSFGPLQSIKMSRSLNEWCELMCGLAVLLLSMQRNIRIWVAYSGESRTSITVDVISLVRLRAWSVDTPRACVDSGPPPQIKTNNKTRQLLKKDKESGSTFFLGMNSVFWCTTLFHSHTCVNSFGSVLCPERNAQFVGSLLAALETGRTMDSSCDATLVICLCQKSAE